MSDLNGTQIFHRSFGIFILLLLPLCSVGFLGPEMKIEAVNGAAMKHYYLFLYDIKGLCECTRAPPGQLRT
jgi:hypothetical protein